MQCSKRTRTRQRPGALKPKSYSLVEGNRSIVTVKPCKLLSFQTLPRILCASAVSHLSLLDLFGPIAGATNPFTWHVYGELHSTFFMYFTTWMIENCHKYTTRTFQSTLIWSTQYNKIKVKILLHNDFSVTQIYANAAYILMLQNSSWFL